MRTLHNGTRDLRAVVPVAFAAVLLTACGSVAGPSTSGKETPGAYSSSSTPTLTPEESTSFEPASATVSRWEEVDLGPVLGDDVVSLTEHDGEVWFAHLTEDRAAIEVRNLTGEQTHLLDAVPSSSPPQLRSTSLGLLVVTSDYETFLPKTWLSTDNGETWTEGTISDRPFDVSGVTMVDGHLLAPGAFRPADQPNSGPFTPGLFRSDDGVTWHETALDPAVFDSTDGYIGPILDQGDRLLTTSTHQQGDYGVPALFESRDRGLTWQTAPDTGPTPTAIVAAGATLIGVNSTNGTGEPITTNSSGAWSPTDLTRFVPSFQNATAFLLAGGPTAIVALGVEPTVEYCYEQRDACGRGYRPALLLIDEDGSAVSVDLGIAATQFPTSALVRADGSLVVATYNKNRFVLRTWDINNGPVPNLPDVEPFIPNGPAVVQWNSDLEVGTTYRFPLGTHCGIDILGIFNGQNWWIVGAPGGAYETLQLESAQQILGEVTMIDDATIEYRLDGELIATYAPRSEEFPGCD